MTTHIYTPEQAEKLTLILQDNQALYCSCGRQIDFGDISWNDASTEAGTPMASVSGICQGCGKELFHFFSWYPGISDIDELLWVMESDFEG